MASSGASDTKNRCPDIQSPPDVRMKPNSAPATAMTTSDGDDSDVRRAMPSSSAAKTAAGTKSGAPDSRSTAFHT